MNFSSAILELSKGDTVAREAWPDDWYADVQFEPSGEFSVNGASFNAVIWDDQGTVDYTLTGDDENATDWVSV
jgi:hypothetical protein